MYRSPSPSLDACCLRKFRPDSRCERRILERFVHPLMEKKDYGLHNFQTRGEARMAPARIGVNWPRQAWELRCPHCSQRGARSRTCEGKIPDFRGRAILLAVYNDPVPAPVAVSFKSIVGDSDSVLKLEESHLGVQDVGLDREHHPGFDGPLASLSDPDRDKGSLPYLLDTAPHAGPVPCREH